MVFCTDDEKPTAISQGTHQTNRQVVSTEGTKYEETEFSTDESRRRANNFRTKVDNAGAGVSYKLPYLLDWDSAD